MITKYAQLHERIGELEEQLKIVKDELSFYQKPKTSRIVSYWIECGYCNRRGNPNILPPIWKCKYCKNVSMVTSPVAHIQERMTDPDEEAFNRQKSPQEPRY